MYLVILCSSCFFLLLQLSFLKWYLQWFKVDQLHFLLIWTFCYLNYHIREGEVRLPWKGIFLLTNRTSLPYVLPRKTRYRGLFRECHWGKTVCNLDAKYLAISKVRMGKVLSWTKYPIHHDLAQFQFIPLPIWALRLLFIKLVLEMLQQPSALSKEYQLVSILFYNRDILGFYVPTIIVLKCTNLLSFQSIYTKFTLLQLE